ncbi:hypothetical protein GCM10009780_77950 [Actinomadura alba]
MPIPASKALPVTATDTALRMRHSPVMAVFNVIDVTVVIGGAQWAEGAIDVMPYRDLCRTSY